MNYTEFKPKESLEKYIQLIWIAESETKEDFYPIEKILPDGIVEIVFHFNEPFITYYDDKLKIKQPKAFAISQMRKLIEIESNGLIGFISVRFYPWGAYHFFEKPIKDFLDKTIDLQKVWADDYQKILQELKVSDNFKRVEIIQNFLDKCLHQYKKDTDDIDNAIKLIRETKGKYSIDTLCEKLNLNYKQLERQFLKTIGTTPKVFSKTTRFLNLCHHLKDYENLTMTQLAIDMGYFDQAHFNKDFKAFSGLTPREFFQQNNVSFADF
jgi:AraC-like DNA-binding protein